MARWSPFLSRTFFFFETEINTYRYSLGFQKESITISREEMAQMIDHTNIRPTTTVEDIKKLRSEAIKYGFITVVVNPTYVPLAVKLLRNSAVKVCATIGFPLGVTLPEVKAYETGALAEMGAREFDMVINLGALKSKNYDTVKRDIKAVVDIKHSHPSSVVKVIIETGFLSEEEKIVARKLSREAGADFVKTSTGMLLGKATVQDIKLMRKTVGSNMGVEASAGVRTLKQALTMVEAGANRIGTSTGAQIIEEIPE